MSTTRDLVRPRRFVGAICVGCSSVSNAAVAAVHHSAAGA